MNWDRLIATTRQGKYPNELFVRFVARNFYGVADRSRVRFLDIGCGIGANSWYLAREGFEVVALDKSASALASLKYRFEQERFFRDLVTFEQCNAVTWFYPEYHFDCILDCNTLCHVETPPMFAIRDALKKDGKFFCVAPADDTWKGTLEGKGYCRTTNEEEMRELLKPFGEVKIRKASYPDRDHMITSWIAECSR